MKNKIFWTFYPEYFKNVFFSPLVCQESTHGKKFHFWQEPWTNPIKKMAIFYTFFKSSLFCYKKFFFFYLEYLKKIFSSLVCLKNWHGKKLDILTKTWTNLFEKSHFGDIFETSLFWSKIYPFLFRIFNSDRFFLGFQKKHTW